MPTKTPPKRDVMLALLQQSESVYVDFDPRREGVIVPPQLKRQPHVVLQYGMNMAIAIPDLDIGDDGIGATLSFDRKPCWTFVPWTAVRGIVSQDQRGVVWKDDDSVEEPAPPPTLAVAPTRDQRKPTARGGAEKASDKPKKAKRPSLRAVTGARESRATGKLRDAARPAEPAAPPPPRPILRVEREARVAGVERPRPDSVGADGGATRPSDEIVEPPQRDNNKKKRELPPYLRVVK